MSTTNLSHDFDSISPSAYALLVMKSQTSIPYMREAAGLLNAKQQYDPIFGSDQAEYRARLAHFESRYWSIDQLLADLPATNILELSSGFSFRGLALSQQKNVFYIDTDLPAVIEGKQRFIDALRGGASQGAADQAPVEAPQSAAGGQPHGHYELQPLNVLDQTAFQKLVEKFPPGPLTIVNEGLLVYLDQQEKEQLCQNIKNILQQRGGHWITADIYIKRGENDPIRDDSYRKWAEQHKLEEKKFDSFEQAKRFFEQTGFKIDKEAQPDYSKLTSLSQLRRLAVAHTMYQPHPGRTRLHSTWLLSLEA